ncbi:MAG TPA: hypothetical protein VHM91_21930 [Verrucomicrobiales bacterium]|nr:hypothetical protein [Verrucomicrobiales bacterium]
MDIPNNRKSSSPITGRSSPKKTKAAATPGPATEAERKETAEDIVINEEVFELPGIQLPPSPPSKESSGPLRRRRDRTAETENAPPPEERVPRKNNLEHRASGQPLQFKRLLRPETIIASNVAAERARAESPASLDSVDHTAMQFGKIHAYGTPGYRPNRLFRVLDSIYKHSPLRWMDFIERGGVRFVAVTLILLTVGGFVVWRIYDSLAKEEESGPKVPTLTSAERIERGKKAVQEFMAAQTIEARLPLVIDPDRAGPRMKEFYAAKGEDPKITNWEVGAPMNGKQGVWLPLLFQDSAGRKAMVVIEETGKGCRIDWENFVAYGEMPWQEFCRSAPSTAKTMRVRLRQVDVYGGAYTQDKYQSYEIEHRSGLPRLVGYVDRAGRSVQRILEVVKGDGTWQSAQLYLQFDTRAGGENQVLILDIVRNRWQDEVTAWEGP